MTRFTLYNDNFYKEGESFLSAEDLSKKLFSIEMKLAKTKLLFWDEYQEIIMLYLRLYGISAKHFEPTQQRKIARQIQRSYVRNKLYMGVTVRLTFFREAEGFVYMVELVDECRDVYEGLEPKANMELVSNDKMFKNKTYLSSLSLGSKALWDIAQSRLKPRQIPLIFDVNKNILEVPRANIFIVASDKTVYTPHASIGVCINPAREIAFSILADLGYKVKERKQIGEEQVQTAQEVFVVGDLKGVQLITAFEEVRYYKTIGTEVHKEFMRRVVG